MNPLPYKATGNEAGRRKISALQKKAVQALTSTAQEVFDD